MDIHSSKIGTRGQATIPANIRKILNLSSGDNIVFEQRDEEVVLRKAMPLDIAYLQSLNHSLSPEWNSPADQEAFDEL